MGDRAMGLFGGFVVMRPDERKKFITEEAGELTVGREYYSILQAKFKTLFFNKYYV
jgi:hypothetical protein